MSQPLVSVLMAAYNVEQYIDQAVQSVLGQTYNDIELLIVDDNSSDATKSRIMSYGDRRIRAFSLSSQNGPSYCRNFGLERAEGQFVTVLDADDWWDASRVEKLAEMVQQWDTDLAIDNLWLIDDGHRTPWTTYFDEADVSIAEGLVDVEQIIRRDYGPLKPLVKRDVFRGRSGLKYRTDLTIGEDFEFMTRLLCLRPRTAMTFIPYYFYRRRAGSLVSNRQTSLVELRDSAVEMRRHIERYPGMETALEERIHFLDRAIVRHRFGHLRKSAGIAQLLTLAASEPEAVLGLVRDLPRWIRRAIHRKVHNMKERAGA